MLIPAPEDRAASAIALAEPWACVEDAYVSKERTTLKAGGQMLIVADTEVPLGRMSNLLHRYGTPAKITWVSKLTPPADLAMPVTLAKRVDDLDGCDLRRCPVLRVERTHGRGAVPEDRRQRPAEHRAQRRAVRPAGRDDGGPGPLRRDSDHRDGRVQSGGIDEVHPQDRRDPPRRPRQRRRRRRADGHDARHPQRLPGNRGRQRVRGRRGRHPAGGADEDRRAAGREE